MPKSCPVCGSRKWRKDGVTGNAVCEDGHVFQDFRSENFVVENVAHTLQKRAQRRQKKGNKRQLEGRANAELYHGEEAEWLKLQALQLMLRHQVAEITKLWQLTEALEVVVRELWAYQLAISPVPPAPGSATRPNSPSPVAAGPEEKVDDKHDEDAAAESGSDSGSNSSREKEDDKLDDDILEEISDRSDDSDDEQGNYNRDGAGQGRGPVWRRRRPLRASDTLVTLITALWVLRVPILNLDIQTLVNENRLCYLDFAYITLIPKDMFKRMNRVIRAALSPRKSPTTLFLHKETRQFARTLHRHFGVNIPEINLPPLSWRLLYSVGGSPTMYHQVHRLLAMLDVNLSLLDTDLTTVTMNHRGRRGKSTNAAIREIVYKRTARYRDVVLPELAVMAAWIIVMKMVYGLDGQTRSAASDSDPLASMPNPSSLMAELRTRMGEGGFRRAAHLEEQDFASMTTDDLDRYLDLSQTVLLDSHPLPTDTGPFTLPPLSDVEPALPPSWSAFHQSVRPHGLGLDSDLAAGEKLRSWDAQDVTGTLPRRYETILQMAAEVIGVQAIDVATMVETYERKLENLRKERGRSGSRSGSQSRSHSRANSVVGVGRKQR